MRDLTNSLKLRVRGMTFSFPLLAHLDIAFYATCSLPIWPSRWQCPNFAITSGLAIFHLEDHLRTQIDASLASAGSLVQPHDQTALGAALGVAIRPLSIRSGVDAAAPFVICD